MSGKNGMGKRKNKGYRWIAAMLTMALLIGQCRVPVLAQEENAPVETGISDENGAGAQEGSDQEMDDDASKDEEKDNDQSGADNGGAGEDDGGNGSTQDNGTGNDGEGEPGAGDIGTGDEDADQGGEEDSPENCVCETACTEDAVNEDCPVCAADYANCAKNAGGGVNPSEEIGEEESVSENDMNGDADAALMAADEGVETYAVGDKFYYSYMGQMLHYAVVTEINEVTKVGEVEVIRGQWAASGDVAIPEFIKLNENDVGAYRVTGIDLTAFQNQSDLVRIKIPKSVTSIPEKAFKGCTDLVKVELPESVTSIGGEAFRECRSLVDINIPKGVTRIEQRTFYHCTSLMTIELPENLTFLGGAAFCESSITSVDIPDSVTTIESGAFHTCRRLSEVKLPPNLKILDQTVFSHCSELASIELPKSVTRIELMAFCNCSNLTNVTISENVTYIDNYCFEGDIHLKNLNIVILSDGRIQFPFTVSNAFEGLPDERYIYFVDKDNKALTGVAYDNAKAAFEEAAKNDNDPFDNPNDGKWYGWSLGDPLEGNDTYTVTINVKKDGTPWSGHGRTFALLGGGSSGFLEVPGQTEDSFFRISQVPDGTYRIYDITGVPADSLYSRARDTGAEVRVSGADTQVDVTVNGADEEEDIHYYTATFL